MKFCSFFQIVFSFFFYTVKADWGGPCPSPFLKEVICVIEVKNLVKRYGDHYAVNHLSFTVEDGQIFGFLGPNGAGKSTTMNIMTGYLAATEGQVLVEGHDILEEPEAARACIGYLPEIPPLYPDMTVEEYLRFCAELKKIPKEQRTDQLTKVLALTHLEDMSARLIRNLSKGYRQRVGLAQAILGFPKIIILDEPTVGLDPKQVVEIRDLIRHLAKDHTVILSSHILSEIRAVCDRVLIIRKGRFVVCDTPEDLEEKLSAGGSLELTAKAAPEAAEARPAKPKRFQTGAKVWLILCIIAAAFQTLSFFNLFYLYGNQDVFSAVFAAYPELSPMRDLLDMMMQSVSVYLWFYILEASLLLLKCAGLIWFAASARRTAFLATAIVAGLLCILTFVTAGLAQALLNAAGVVILYVLLRKQWHTLRK